MKIAGAVAVTAVGTAAALRIGKGSTATEDGEMPRAIDGGTLEEGKGQR